MARICQSHDSDEDLPDLDDIIRNHLKTKPILCPDQTSPVKANQRSPQRKNDLGKPKHVAARSDLCRAPAQNPQSTSDTQRRPKNLSSRLNKSGHVRAPAISESAPSSDFKPVSPQKAAPSPAKLRATPGRNAKSKVHYDFAVDDGELSFEQSDVEDSIWCDSDASDGEQHGPDTGGLRRSREPLFIRRNTADIRKPLSVQRSRLQDPMDTNDVQDKWQSTTTTETGTPSHPSPVKVVGKVRQVSSEKENDEFAMLKL